MFNIDIITAVLASVILAGISIFILFKEWRSQANRNYFYFNISAMAFFAIIFFSYAYPHKFDPALLNKIAWIITIIASAFFFTLTFVFPGREKPFRYYKISIIMLPAFIIALIIISNTVLKDFHVAFINKLEPYYEYYFIVIILYLLAGVINLIQRYVKTDVRIHKSQIRYVFIGLAIAVLCFVFCTIILPKFFDYSALITSGRTFSIIILSVFIFYAMIAHNAVNARRSIYKIIINMIISAFIAAPVVALMILYDFKIWIFNEIPLYLMSLIIAISFLFLSVILYPAINKIFKSRHLAFEGFVNSLIISTENIRNIRDIIRSAADILYKSLSVKNIFVMLLNNETKIFEKFYFKGTELDIKPIDINSPLIRWFAKNNKVLNTDSVYTEEKSYSEMKEDINNIILKLNIKVILPVYNDRQIIGLICLGEKDSMSLYKSNEISELQRFNQECNMRISNAIDYEEWNQGQFVSGILDLSSEVLSKAVPVNLPKLSEISFGAFYIPRYREGIDYFDFITPTNIGAGVIATDISGRGINNAIYSVILRSAFHSCIEEAHSTFATMQKLNKALHDYTKGIGGIVKAYYFYYNINTMRLIYTNAGFQPLEIYRVDKNIYESLDTDGYPLGTDLTANYGMGRTNLLVGDIGFLYSRALIESKNQKGEKFGLTQLRRIIKENRRRHPSEITTILKEEFLSFMGTSSPGANILVIIFKV